MLKFTENVFSIHPPPPKPHGFFFRFLSSSLVYLICSRSSSESTYIHLSLFCYYYYSQFSGQVSSCNHWVVRFHLACAFDKNTTCIYIVWTKTGKKNCIDSHKSKTPSEKCFPIRYVDVESNFKQKYFKRPKPKREKKKRREIVA